MNDGNRLHYRVLYKYLDAYNGTENLNWSNF